MNLFSFSNDLLIRRMTMKKLFAILYATIISICPFAVFTTYQNNIPDVPKIYAETDITPYGGTPLDVIEEQIDYSHKVVDKYYNPYELPHYLSSYTCGISAGGEIIGFYDRIYDELIPNHTGRIFLGKYLYAPQDDEVNKMYDILNTLMNATSEGVTINNFINGVKSYVNSKGRSASFKSAIKNNSLDFNTYKQAILSNKLISIFADGFNIIQTFDFEEHDHYDYLTIYRNNGAHIMVAYGYYDVKYYDTQNRCFRHDNYLYVSTGVSIPALALLRINQYCTVDDAYITEII